MDASYRSLIVPGLVDSALKLQLLLLFYRHPRLCGEACRLNDWLHESPWAIEEALDAMKMSAYMTSHPFQPDRLHSLSLRL